MDSAVPSPNPPGLSTGGTGPGASTDAPDGVAWLDSRQGLGITPGLSRVWALLASVGEPQDDYRSVHVAGTNGKGSVATLIASALERSGHRTGLFTSPALSDVTDTIRVDDVPITPLQLTHIVETLRPVVARMDREENPPSYFELLTVIALVWFRESSVDWAVVEAGMGGRLDSTNILQPELAIITNVAHDHAAYLGDSIPEIAEEKAGIVKPSVPLVTAAHGEALAVIRRVCLERGAPIVVIGEGYEATEDDGRLGLTGPNGRMDYRLAAKGAHQSENAAVAVAGCDLLRESGVHVPAEAVRQALAETTLPGRIEVVSRDGIRVILDGAHNVAAAKSLRAYVESLDTRFHLIVGFSEDKNWPAILQTWLPLADRVTATRIRSPRSFDPSLAAEQVGTGTPFTAAATFESAWNEAVDAASRDVLVAGSLFLVGEARELLVDSTDPGRACQPG